MKNHSLSIVLTIGTLLTESFWFLFALGNGEKINAPHYWIASLFFLCIIFGIGEFTAYSAKKLSKHKYAYLILGILFVLILFYVFGLRFFVTEAPKQPSVSNPSLTNRYL